MSRFEKRLCVLALIFVVVYLGAVALTLQLRIEKKSGITRLESAQADPGESRLMLAELFLPMLVLFVITLCFSIAKKKRERDRKLLDDSKKGSAAESSERSP